MNTHAEPSAKEQCKSINYWDRTKVIQHVKRIDTSMFQNILDIVCPSESLCTLPPHLYSTRPDAEDSSHQHLKGSAARLIMVHMSQTG